MSDNWSETSESSPELSSIFFDLLCTFDVTFKVTSLYLRRKTSYIVEKNNNTVIKNVYKGIILLIVPKTVNS